MEDRSVPAICTVLNLNDAGASSLRDCITQMNAAGAGYHSIPFDEELSGTIGLQSALPTLNVNVGIYAFPDDPDRITVSGSGNHRVFQVAAGKTVSIDGLTITGGNAGVGGNGGAILNNGTLNLYYVILSNNTAGLGGGAIYNALFATLTMENSRIDNCTAFSGGGIYNAGNAWVQWECRINGCSASGDGGGIYNSGTGTITITDTDIDGNTAQNGGGIYTKGALTMDSGQLYENSATFFGGGLDINGNPTVDLFGVDIVSNAANKGGGVYLLSGTLNLNGMCVVSDNSATTLGPGTCKYGGTQPGGFTATVNVGEECVMDDGPVAVDPG